MSQTDQNDDETIRVRFSIRVAALTSAFAVVSLVVAPLAYHYHGTSGLAAVFASFAVCLFCGVITLGAADLLRKPEMVIHQVAVNLVFRTGIPLAVCILAYFKRSSLADAGFVYYLLVYYFVGLAVETLLAVQGHAHSKLFKRPAKV